MDEDSAEMLEFLQEIKSSPDYQALCISACLSLPLFQRGWNMPL